MSRILGRFDGSEKGPLFICFAALHGNEPAGVKAVNLILKLLEVEPISNPGFKYKGRFLGLLGNIPALKEQTRYIEKDLNRQFTPENVKRVMDADKDTLQYEDLELREIIELINEEIKAYDPPSILFLDLHTTSSTGGIFSICEDNPESIRIATALHAPVVLGIISIMQGTTLHYFNNKNYIADAVSLTFEAGYHDDPLSVNRAISAIINCMKEIGSVSRNQVENFHEEILIRFSDNLPKVTELTERYEVTPGQEFIMNPGYENFQFVKKGEIVAYDKNGPVRVKSDGLLLMPLYQPKGEDGFFLIKVLEERQ